MSKQDKRIVSMSGEAKLSSTTSKDMEKRILGTPQKEVWGEGRPVSEELEKLKKKNKYLQEQLRDAQFELGDNTKDAENIELLKTKWEEALLLMKREEIVSSDLRKERALLNNEVKKLQNQVVTLKGEAELLTTPCPAPPVIPQAENANKVSIAAISSHIHKKFTNKDQRPVSRGSFKINQEKPYNDLY